MIQALVYFRFANSSVLLIWVSHLDSILEITLFHQLSRRLSAKKSFLLSLAYDVTVKTRGENACDPDESCLHLSTDFSLS